MLATLTSQPHSFNNNVRATAELDPVISRSQAIQKNLAVFLERTEYTLGSEPVILDKSVEDTILSDIFSRSIPVDKKQATEIARLSAVIGHVSIPLLSTFGSSVLITAFFRSARIGFIIGISKCK
jgi:hypothetical protein